MKAKGFFSYFFLYWIRYSFLNCFKSACTETSFNLNSTLFSEFLASSQSEPEANSGLVIVQPTQAGLPWPITNRMVGKEPESGAIGHSLSSVILNHILHRITIHSADINTLKKCVCAWNCTMSTSLWTKFCYMKCCLLVKRCEFGLGYFYVEFPSCPLVRYS